jgi:hypothetical protein
MENETPDYRHATSDLWEAAALWAHGAVISHTKHDGERMVFCFAYTQGLAEAAQQHRRSDLKVSSLLMREGYYQVRALLDPRSQHARRR